MALRINLYHEIQKQQLARRRDPLKLGMLGLLCIGVGFVGYYLVRVEQLREMKIHVATLELDWSKLEPKQKVAKARADELEAKVKLSQSLVKHIEGRFFWAPLLEQILQNVPDQVQLTKITGLNTPDNNGNLNLTVTGIAGSDTPRKVAEHFREALEEKFGQSYQKVDSHFNSLEDADEVVTVAAKASPTANFAIDIQLIKTIPPVAAAPAPARAKKVAVE